MTLKLRLIAAVFVTVFVIGALNLLALHRIAALDRETFAEHRAEASRAVDARIGEILAELDSAAINLSRPRDIVNALHGADNETLSDWSAAFVGSADHEAAIDTIVFTDTGGMVIARAPDEFRFGDDVSTTQPVFAASRDGSFLGIAPVDGRPSLVAARALRKYDDVPVGVVYVACAITPDVLSKITGSRNVVLTYADAGGTISGEAALPIAHAAFSEAVATAHTNGRFRLSFLPDPNHERMLHLQTLLSMGAVIASALTLVAMLLVLRRELAPYDAIIGGIRAYADRTTTLPLLRKRLERAELRRDPQAGKVAAALVRMIDSLEGSFREIAANTARLEDLARNDALTSLPNRRALDEALEAEMRRIRRYGGAFTVILADIDHFKDVNDRFGHAVGDQVLRQVADLLHTSSRATDMVGRWGGEEFLLLCPDTDAAAVACHAEKLRRAVADTVFPDGIRLTASFGIAEARSGEPIAQLIERADRALYAAKAAGRDTVR